MWDNRGRVVSGSCVRPGKGDGYARGRCVLIHLVHNERAIRHRLWNVLGTEKPHKLGLSTGRDTSLVANVECSHLTQGVNLQTHTHNWLSTHFATRPPTPHSNHKAIGRIATRESMRKKVAGVLSSPALQLCAARSPSRTWTRQAVGPWQREHRRRRDQRQCCHRQSSTSLLWRELQRGTLSRGPW